ncbi:hypothetical protein BKA83DRAFT_4481318 [Pisolithus microcarpus]|nr:hypothetical protein BKA83DRAFT_4481318 [Pisolithus microcarpus]
MWDRCNAIKDAMTDGRMIDEETTDGAELPNRVKVASTVKPVVSHYTEDPRAFVFHLQTILMPQDTSNWPKYAAIRFRSLPYRGENFSSVEGTGSIKLCRYWLKGFHVERDRLAKQPAPFIGFTQLFRYMTPLELFLDAIGVVGAKAAGVAQPRFSEG